MIAATGASAAAARRHRCATIDIVRNLARPFGARLPFRLVVLAILTATGQAVAQPNDIWRHFSSTDGLVESYVGAVSIGTAGQIWITHGQVPEMSVFDGFSVKRLPSPGIDARVEEGSDGELWAMDIQPGHAPTGLKTLIDGRWKSFPLSDIGVPDPELLLAAAGAQRFLPRAKGHVLYVAEDGLREFDSSTGRSNAIRLVGCALGTLRAIVASGPSAFWVSGDRGIGRISAWPPVDGGAPCVSWLRGNPASLSEFGNLFDDGDSLFATARDPQNRRLVIRAGPHATEVLARTAAGESGILGWSAGDGKTWLLRIRNSEPHLFCRFPNGNEEPAPKSKVLSGRIRDVAVQAGGVSWIASSLGVARYSPPVWQPLGPPGVSEQTIGSIAETPRGDRLFLGVDTLWIESGSQWIEKRLPIPPLASTGTSNRMSVLADGKIAIPLRLSGEASKLLVYDSERDRFETPAVSGYDDCAFVAPRSNGRAWVACQGGGNRITLFSYDGSKFERSFEIPVDSQNEWPRAVAELPDGSIWVGAFWRDSLFRYANGVVEKIVLPPEAAAMGVSDIARLPNGRVWVGGRNLLLEYDGTAWRVLQRNLETVRAIYPARDGSVWIAGGVAVMRCRDDGCVSVGVEEGLPEAAAWTVFEDPEGRLMVGTTAGLRVREAAADRDPPVAEVPHQLNVTRFAPGGEVRLLPTGKDRWGYTQEDRLLFSHRLDGGPWSPFESLTVVSLRGIASGSHAFEVRAMDRNFNVGPPASYRFEVLAPWYRQPSMVLFAVLAALVLGYSAYQHLSRHRELARLVELKTRQLSSDYEERLSLQVRFEAILDHAPTLIFVKDLEGRYIVSNLRHREFLGKTRDEIIGKTDDEIFGSGSSAPFQRNDEEVLAEQRIVQFEEADPQSSRVYLSIKSPLHDSAGRLNAVCLIATDITESKQLQERLENSQRLEAVGLLAGGIAHDFNNLLTVINGYSDLLLGKIASDSPLRMSLTEVRKAGERAASLTAQLLAFSRRQIIRPAALDPSHLVSDLDTMLRRLIGEDIEMVTHVAPDVGNVMADAGQFQQILMNLVVNARDAMPGGGRLLIEIQNAAFDEEYVGHHPEARPGSYVMLAVSDTGTGMTPEVQARVFEPFFTTKERGKGTGLGLASVYGMVKQSRGWISVYSEPGHGSTFRVYLPRTDELAPAPKLEPGPEIYGSETILVVEDQAEVRMLAVEALRKYGYTVYEAASGAEAMSFLRGFAGIIELLVTDVVMPGMNGQELARQARESRPGLKVICMSGYADAAITRYGALDIQTGYLQKPFTPESLGKKVREILGHE